jgi:metal-responsive CopG/Arc/MetJ family transcriptional regulator
MAVQVNVKIDEKLANQLDELVRSGYVRTKREAFEKAIMMLLREQRATGLESRIAEIRRGTEKAPSVTEAATRAHEEED